MSQVPHEVGVAIIIIGIWRPPDKHSLFCVAIGFVPFVCILVSACCQLQLDARLMNLSSFNRYDVG